MAKLTRKEFVSDYLSQFPKKKPTSKEMELRVIVGEMLTGREEETKIAKKIVEKIVYITLSTCSKSAIPWISPLFCAYDKDYNFYWISSQKSVHSANIEENENVAMVIYDSTAPEGKGYGVYMSAKAAALENIEDIRRGLAALYKRKRKPAPDAKLFFGDSRRKVYMAVPKLFFVNDLKIKSEERRDLRIQVDLK